MTVTEPTPEEVPAPPEEAPAEPTPEAEVVHVADGDSAIAGDAHVAAPAEKVRRGRGNLESDVKNICDAYAKGDITLADGEYLTPHRIANLIVTRLEEASKPSTGAVAACLKRWVDYGYIVANEKAPFAFLDFTDAARTEGLAALKEKFRAAKKAATAEATTEVSEPTPPVEASVPAESEVEEATPIPDPEPAPEPAPEAEPGNPPEGDIPF